MKYALSLQSITWGIASTFGLILFYFLTMRVLTGSWEAAFSQFEKLWYFMLPLSMGFGIQVCLYAQIKRGLRHADTTKIMAANTTASGVAMIACCAHHLTELLPFLGLSFASVFLVSYQIPILISGIILNLIGIAYHINIARRIAERRRT